MGKMPGIPPIITSFFLLKLGPQTPLVIQKIYPEAMPVEKYIFTV
jgi:hypothetical protein